MERLSLRLRAMQPTAGRTLSTPRPLSAEELSLLRSVRLADEEEGGLALDDLGDEELATLRTLVGRGLVDVRLGEDGEGWARINARGVEALRSLAD